MEAEVMLRERFGDAMMLAFQMEERVMSQRMQETSRRWKRQGFRFPSRGLLHSLPFSHPPNFSKVPHPTELCLPLYLVNTQLLSISKQLCDFAYFLSFPFPEF